MTDFIQFEQAILGFGSLILGPFLGVLLAFAINKAHNALTPGFMESRNRRVFVAQIS